MFNGLLLVLGLAIAAYLAFSPRLAKAEGWRATVTPLASIMGSGFLVSAPLLAATVGIAAMGCMALLLAVAYAVGHAIRFNIGHFEPIENRGHGVAQNIAFLSRIVLAGAYFISVTYYLQLLAAFVLRVLGVDSLIWADVVTTTLLLLITGIGMWRGLGELEKIERYAVSLNFGMVGALLVALVVYNLQRAIHGQWQLPAIASGIDFHDFRVLLGLMIVVQGFETSRYLQNEHPAALRITSMRWAQRVSAVIYLLFVGLATVLFQDHLGSDVTAITQMVKPVASLLPALIIAAAIASQFSAAVADTSGAGGLIEDIAHQKLPVRYAYLAILLITVALTWQANVNEIIAYASRAFALFYMLQCAVAFVVLWRDQTLPARRRRLVLFAITTLICALIFALGVPSE